MNVLGYVLQDLEKHFLKFKFSLHCSFYSVTTIKNSKKKFDVLGIKSLQEKSFKPNTAISLHILGSGAIGSPRSLYVHTANNKFLFNCGEGLRRISNEYNKPISTVSGVFITANSWDNVSGLPGLQEYAQHSSKQTINVYAPSGLAPLVDTFTALHKELAHLKHTPIRDHKLDFEQSLNIEAVPISSSTHPHESLIEDDVRYLGKGRRDAPYVVAYICRPQSNTGSVNIELLVQAGVPPGPLVQRLKEGSAVSLADGRVVHPRQVMTGAYKGGAFLVVEIPSVDYLASLGSCPAFRPFQQGGDAAVEPLEAVVHFSPPAVMRDARYLSWVSSLPASASHLVFNERNACLGLKASLAFQLRLNHFLPRVFPLLHDASIPSLASRSDNPNSKDSIDPGSATDEYQFCGPTVHAANLLQYHIRPLLQFDSSSCPVLYPAEVVRSCFQEEGVAAAVEKAKRRFAALARKGGKGESPFPRLVFLGTGSAGPSVFRNESGILVSADEDQHALLDCGEGTFNQLVRFMGVERTRATLRHLRLVFVSHHHHDHHQGLSSILLQRQEAFRHADQELEPLCLLLTTPVARHLKRIHECFLPILKNTRLVNNVNLLRDGHFFDAQQHDRVCEALGLRRIDLAFVRHVSNSFGVSLSHARGWKLTYSGDTKPSPELVKIGMGSDVLIHEATFDDTMREEAEMKRHSTAGQAVAAGRQMKAKFTLLTHFSQRYSHIPSLEGGCPDDVGVAFDNMQVEPSDLPYLPHLYPVLKEMFCQDLDELKAKQYRRINFG